MYTLLEWGFAELQNWIIANDTNELITQCVKRNYDAHVIHRIKQFKDEGKGKYTLTPLYTLLIDDPPKNAPTLVSDMPWDQAVWQEGGFWSPAHAFTHDPAATGRSTCGKASRWQGTSLTAQPGAEKCGSCLRLIKDKYERENAK